MSKEWKGGKGGAKTGIQPEMSKTGPISAKQKSKSKNTGLKRKLKKIGGAKSRNGREFRLEPDSSQPRIGEMFKKMIPINKGELPWELNNSIKLRSQEQSSSVIAKTYPCNIVTRELLEINSETGNTDLVIPCLFKKLKGIFFGFL